MSTVCRKRHIKAHYECLSKSIRRWEVPLETRPGTEDGCWYGGHCNLCEQLQAWSEADLLRPSWWMPPPSACKINSCLLSTAQDWQWRVDIGNRLKVPEQIATTTLRPDLILWSTETKQVLLIELTVLWEENIEVACERTLEKYQELVEQCKVNKWRTACYPIEVGCRGFAGRSVCRVLSRLGMIGEKRERPSERF